MWWAPINTPRSALEDPQVIASGAFVEMPDGAGGDAVRSVASPIDIDGAAQRPGPSPALGEHTADVLAELGYTPADITSRF